ncbi:hypothetical protein [Citrobacter phage Ci1]|nr:hypothetical protein [Citrobacter phage Ci1]
MPVYNYACTYCKHQFDAMNSIQGRMFKECPKCKKQACKTVSAPGGIVNGEYQQGKMYVSKK